MPSFAQRWWLQRIATWRERHPEIAIELHTSQQIVDLSREGFDAALADEPLLGDAPIWESGCALAGVSCRVNPVASLNGAGSMLQLAEQNLGLALDRERPVADAMRDRRLTRRAPIALSKDQAYALRKGLFDQLQRSERWLRS